MIKPTRPALTCCVKPVHESFETIWQPRFARVLRRWRVSHKKKIAGAAAELGVATSTWGGWEKSKKALVPSLGDFHMICNHIGIPALCMHCPKVEGCYFSEDDSAKKKGEIA